MTTVKRCGTLTDCSYKHHCDLYHKKADLRTQTFFPQNTGEFCDHYVKKADQGWGEGADTND